MASFWNWGLGENPGMGLICRDWLNWEEEPGLGLV